MCVGFVRSISYVLSATAVFVARIFRLVLLLNTMALSYFNVVLCGALVLGLFDNSLFSFYLMN